jgi:hypothetical protein
VHEQNHRPSYSVCSFLFLKTLTALQFHRKTSMDKL